MLTEAVVVLLGCTVAWLLWELRRMRRELANVAKTNRWLGESAIDMMMPDMLMRHTLATPTMTTP